MSLEKKVRVGLLALAGNTACSDENYSVNLGGVIISEAVTESDGIAAFVEKVLAPGKSEEEVEVEVTAFGNRVPGASVLYFDNMFSEGFFISHPSFGSQLQISLHNSKHIYSLTPASLQILHDSFQKEQSKIGAEAFYSWAKNWESSGWENTGCLNRENMNTLIEPGAYLMEKVGVLKVVSVSSEDFEQGVEYIKQELPPDAVARVYSFISAKHGFQTPTTTLTALEVRFDGKCEEDYAGNNESNGSNNGDNYENNDENQNDQNQSSDCGNYLFCDEFEGTALDISKWNVYGDKGIAVNSGWVSLPNGSSIAAQKDLGAYCSDKNVKVRGIINGGVISLGNGINLYLVDDVGELACGNETAILESIDSSLENLISFYKFPGTLSVSVNGSAASISCYQDITALKLGSGFDDLMKIDYVEVQCE